MHMHMPEVTTMAVKAVAVNAMVEERGDAVTFVTRSVVALMSLPFRLVVPG